jgi:ATP-dependent Lon protease
MLDRLEIIELSGYTTDEKVEIARKHLLPEAARAPRARGRRSPSRRRAPCGMHARGLHPRGRRASAPRRSSPSCAAGWRCEVAWRPRRREHERSRPRRRTTCAPSSASKKMHREKAERLGVPGVAAGLAWTPVGGDLLYVETTSMPGKGKVEITGQLGEVMNESARAALAYLRAQRGALWREPHVPREPRPAHPRAGGRRAQGRPQRRASPCSARSRRCSRAAGAQRTRP